MAAMRVEIEAEKEKLEATKNKYRQQITSMEDEFAEIKTNILRTSARLDTLKAQAEEVVPVVEWEVEPAEAVQMPAADVEVDNVVEIAKAPEPTFEETFFKSEILEQAPVIEEPAPMPEPVQAAVEPEPVIEEPDDSSIEELIASMSSFTEEQAPAAEEAAPEAPEPAAEEAAPEPAAEEAAKPANEIETMLDEISFDDLLGEEPAAETAESTDGIEEINLDELVSLEDEVKAEAKEEPAAEAAKVPEEISFDSLEALFKDEN